MEGIYSDIPRIYTAIAEWSACMMYLILLKKAVLSLKFSVKGILALVCQILLLELTGDWHTALWLPCMFFAGVLMYLFLLIAGNLSVRECMYCFSKAFLLAELAASLEWQIHTHLLRIEITGIVVTYMTLVIVYSLVFGIAYLLERRMFSQSYLEHLSTREALASLGCALVVFAFSNLSFVSTTSLFSTHIIFDVFIIRTLVDVIGVAILYAYQSRICEYAAETEMTALQNVLNSQYDMYRNYQDSVEMIQMKCHDLKHQIAGLRAETDAEKRKEWLDLLEQEADFQEVNVHTGNTVLDAVLGAKNLVAKKNHIQITCVINGQLLDGLHVTDICNIFGNALDNAIENAILIPNEKKRLIHITVSEKKHFVIIKIANYCEQAISTRPGSVPETTKSDKKNHGYGLKSIRKSVEKYKGTMTIAMNHGWFELKLLIPRKTDNGMPTFCAK